MDVVIWAEDISMAAGVLLSLGFSYIPGLAEKFAGLSPTHKRVVMLGLLVLVTCGIFGISCFRSPAANSCDQNSAWKFLRALVMAIIANQSAYALSPRPGTEGIE